MEIRLLEQYISSMHNHYNRRLKPFAREHRNVSTKAEVRLWCELLRDRHMLGYPFLRQRPIDGFIADFFCKELKLVVEVDGATHDEEGAGVRDSRRDARLAELGYSTLRFTDEDVRERIDMVDAALRKWIGENAVAGAKPRRVRSVKRESA